jgi:hypothetical protein
MITIEELTPANFELVAGWLSRPGDQPVVDRGVARQGGRICCCCYDGPQPEKTASS